MLIIEGRINAILRNNVRISKSIIDNDPLLAFRILGNKNTGDDVIQIYFDMYDYGDYKSHNRLKKIFVKNKNEMFAFSKSIEQKRDLDIAIIVFKAYFHDKEYLLKQAPEIVKPSRQLELKHPRLIKLIKNSIFLYSNDNDRNIPFTIANHYATKPDAKSYLNDIYVSISDAERSWSEFMGSGSSSRGKTKQSGLGFNSSTPVMDTVTLGILGLFFNGVANPTPSSPRYSYLSPHPEQSSNGSSTSQTSSSSNRQNSNKTGGYQFLEHIKYRVSQKVVARGKCSDSTRFDVRYSPNTGASYQYTIYSTSGSSKDNVAKKFCRNH